MIRKVLFVSAMTLTRNGVAAAALGLAAVANNVGKFGVGAFSGTPSVGSHRVPCETQPMAGLHLTTSDTVGGKGHHRCHVRDRSGLKIALGKEQAAGGIDVATGTVWGAGTSGRRKRDSRVWMLPEDGATSVSRMEEFVLKLVNLRIALMSVINFTPFCILFEPRMHFALLFVPEL